MEGFKGVLFTLKKRLQNPNRSDNEHYKYVVFGYYDGLDINCTEHWYGLGPKGLSTEEISDPFIDQFTIKALFPENASELEKQGFSYSLFEKIGDDIYNGYPFIAMSLVNISESYVSRYTGLNELNKEMFSFISEGISSCTNSSSLKYAVFPCIGYSDYLAVFLASDFEQAAHVIDHMRSKHFNDDSAVFSSCYTVCGFYMNEGTRNLQNNSSVHLSARINKFKEAAKLEFRKKGLLNQYNDAHIEVKNRQTIINEYLVSFKTFIEKYQTYINANHLQSRISKSLQQLMKNFLNISQLSHCFDAEKILGKAFKGLIHNMEYIFDHAADIKTSDVERALNKFRDVMGSYLSDLICSDKLFIEGQTLTHPSIGSATKLLFAYNSLINTIVKKLIALENHPIGDFTFLVISGGCDKTIAADLFEFLGIQSECAKLIIITIPEMSLYDVKGTLFRLLHECMHFCGERKRKARYQYFIRAIANTTARNFTAIFYNDNELDRLLNIINPYFDSKSEDYKKLETIMESVFYQCKNGLANGIADRINSDPFFTKYGKDAPNEIPYYLSKIENTLLRDFNAAKLFLSKQLADDIYNLATQMDYKKLKYLTKCAEKYGVNFSELNSLLIKSKFLLKNKKQDETTKRFIDIFFSMYMGDLKYLNKLKNMYQHVMWFADIRSVISSAMREGFADCSAIKLLDISFEDFILSFIYEKWNIDEAFPENQESILRIGADLKIAFGITGILNEENKNAIRKKAKYWEERGNTYKNIEPLLDRLDRLLIDYDKLQIYKGTVEIESYLKDCISEIRTDEFLEIQSFCKISNIADQKETYRMIDFLFRQWEGLSNE